MINFRETTTFYIDYRLRKKKITYMYLRYFLPSIQMGSGCPPRFATASNLFAIYMNHVSLLILVDGVVCFDIWCLFVSHIMCFTLYPHTPTHLHKHTHTHTPYTHISDIIIHVVYNYTHSLTSCNHVQPYTLVYCLVGEVYISRRYNVESTSLQHYLTVVMLQWMCILTFISCKWDVYAITSHI